MKKLSVVEKARAASGNLATSNSQQPVLDQRPRMATGPGTMMAHLEKESRVINEVNQLKEQLKGWEGSFPVKTIDPALVQRSRLSNRIEESFKSDAFQEFKAEIRASGGNVVPAKVRPIPDTDPQRYEVIWGQRRHQACLEENLPFLAMIVMLSDKAAFRAADIENRHRLNLSAYEQGLSYVNALESGLYPSIRSLAEDVDVSQTAATTAVRLARLPDYVLSAFPSKLDLQFRWAAPLAEAVAENPDEVRKVSEEILDARVKGKHLTALQIYARLTLSPATKNTNTAAEPSYTIKVKKGQHIITFASGVVDKEKSTLIEAAIRNVLKLD